MPFYHVYVEFKEKGKPLKIFSFGHDENHVRENIASRYMKNEAFMLAGKVIDPINVDTIQIFRSFEWKAKKIILPNGKSAIDDTDYAFSCFQDGLVEGVAVCTPNFIALPPEPKVIKTVIRQVGERKKVFIVHGRDEKPALRLQKYLSRKLKPDAEMFEDFKEESSSNTIIEQLEFIRDNVAYAFVIVTPDDVGCLHKAIEECRTKMLVGKEKITVETVCKLLGKLQTRARQNVVFEHGLFIGALGRDRVCCLFQTDVKEKPSDTDGILYVGFDKSVKETFPEITEKLKKIELVKA